MSTPFATFVQAGTHRTLPLRAPYNFVRLNERVLPSPLGDAIDIGRPRPEHLAGELVVEWTAETPLLVGGASNDQPFRLRDRWALPAASLRGMVRAVMEIASFSRLAFVDDRHLALRDMSHVTWSERLQNATPILSGWLTRRRERDGQWRYVLTETVAVALPLKELKRRLRLESDTVWHEMGVADRYALLATKYGHAWHAGVPGRTTVDWDHAFPAGTEATIVVTGKSVKDEQTGTYPKLKEWAFLEPEHNAPKYELRAATWRRFQDSQFRQSPSLDEDQRQLWSFWWEKFDRDQTGRARIPVFFLGKPGEADQPDEPPRRADRPETFFMSLTRFLKIPYRFSVGEIARRTHDDFDTLDGPIDFTEGLMGFVPPRDPLVSEKNLPRAKALRSRVQLHHGELVGNPPEPTTVSGVSEAPRVSFYPFYLKPAPGTEACHPLDYSSSHTWLAGRKRYPARGRTAAFPPGNAGQASTLAFLPSPQSNRLRFRSRIRFENISEVELGGLVWAITLGGQGKASHTLRHLLGRGKAFGYGQVEAEIVESNLSRRYNGSPAPTLENAMTAFEQWVVDELKHQGRFADLPEIRDLKALADPTIGTALNDKGVLAFPGQQPSCDSEAIVKAYKNIKDQTGREPRPNNPNRGQARSQAAATPEDRAYLRLPRYPWSSS